MEKPAHVDPYVVPEGTVVILKGRHEYSIIDIRNKLARRGLEIRNNVVVKKEGTHHPTAVTLTSR